MDQIKIKLRKFDIIKEIDENSYIASYKNKQYWINKYVPGTEDGNELAYSCNRLNASGVSAPRVFIIDRKNGYVVREYLTGERVSEFIARENLPETMYDDLFRNAYRAKIARMTLNYAPEYWLIVDDKLYYTYPHFINYSKEKDLVDRYLRLWFPTKELVNYLGKNNVFIDKNRLKDEFSTNKEIVGIVCKYYR